MYNNYVWNELNLNNPECPIFNIVTQNSTVGEILKIIQNRVNIRIEYVDSPLMNQASYIVSNKLFEASGFKFSNSIYAEINETLNRLGIS